MTKFIYFGMTVTNQSDIHDKIKDKLDSGDACYHLVKNLIYFSVLPKSMKIKIGEIVILPFVVCMKIGVLF